MCSSRCGILVLLSGGLLAAFVTMWDCLVARWKRAATPRGVSQLMQAFERVQWDRQSRAALRGGLPALGKGPAPRAQGRGVAGSSSNGHSSRCALGGWCRCSSWGASSPPSEWRYSKCWTGCLNVGSAYSFCPRSLGKRFRLE